MTESNSTPSSTLGYELMRHFVLPDLLGHEASGLLYLLGKNLGRKFTMSSIPELQIFFNEAGWGTLTVEKEKKDTCHFILSGDPVEKAFALNTEHSFNLEAGFLAANFASQTGFYTEATEEINHKKSTVILIVKWDRKEYDANASIDSTKEDSISN